VALTQETGEPYDIRKPEAMAWVAAQREAGRS